MAIATAGSAWLISQAQGTPTATAAKSGNIITPNVSTTVQVEVPPAPPF